MLKTLFNKYYQSYLASNEEAIRFRKRRDYIAAEIEAAKARIYEEIAQDLRRELIAKDSNWQPDLDNYILGSK